MTRNVKKISLLLIAAVLVMALAFAGAASADVGPFPNNGVLSSQTYTLTGDVDLTELTAGTKELTVGNDVTATIDLNGYVLKAASNNRVVKVSGTGKLTLTDSNPNAEHSFTFKDGAAWTLDPTFVASAVPLDQFDLAAAKAAPAGTYHVKVTGGIMYGGSQSLGAGVWLSEGGTFEMSSGSIVGCTASTNGGGVCLSSNTGAKGTFKMSGGSIAGCIVTSNVNGMGGGVYVNTGTFEMSSGSIVGCSAYFGGGVYQYEAQKFNMTGGSITGCSAFGKGGGGVFVQSNGPFNMDGGSIKDCSATKNTNNDGMGGGVFVDTGTFIMSSGSITGCSAACPNFGGGGVYVSSGTFTMDGGSISNCTAASSKKGAYVYYNSGGTVNLYNGLFDTTSWTQENFCSYSSGVLSKPGYNATLKNDSDPAWTQWSSSSKDVVECPFSAPAGKYFGYWTDEDGKKVKSPKTGNPGNVYNANWVDPVATIKETGAKYGTVAAAFTAASDGQTIELLDDSTLLREIMVEKTVTLDLKGKTLTAAKDERLFTVNGSGKTFTLKDSGSGGKLTGNGMVTGDGGGVYVNSSTFNMTGNAQITHCNATGNGGGIYNKGTFNMNGEAQISYCNATGNGGGVCNGGTFTMSGDAQISYCNVTGENGYGGGVFNVNFGSNNNDDEESPTFTMSGNAQISHCNSDFGGGVHNYATFNMTGDAQISYCNATGSGGGVCNAGTFNMTGGTIFNCTAEVSGGVQNDGTFTMDGGTIFNCTAEIGSGMSNTNIFTISGSATITSGVALNSEKVSPPPPPQAQDAGMGTTNADIQTNEERKFHNIILDTKTTFTGSVSNITLYDKNLWDGENTSIWMDQIVVKNGNTPAKNRFALSTGPLYSSLALNANGNDLVLGEKPTYVEVSSWDQLVANVTDWTNTTKMRTIAVTGNVKNTTQGSNYKGIPVVGNITVTTLKDTNAAIDANLMGRLFNVTGGNLKLIGNGTSTLTLTNGQIYNAGAVMVDTGNLTISSGANITDCTATNCGGAVFVEAGSLTMDGGNITGCSAVAGGAVFVNFNGRFDMTGGNITGCTVSSAGGGVNIHESLGNSAEFNVSGTATIAGNAKVDLTTGVMSDNNVCLKNSSALHLTGPFTGTISIVEPAATAGTKFGTCVSGYEAYAKNFLSDASGYFGNATGNKLVWTPINTTVTPKNNIAEFHNTNSTTLKTTDVVSMIVLENVSNVDDNTPVVFNASSAITKSLPVSSGYKKIEDVAIFDIEAEPSTGSSSYINVTLTFADADTVDEYKEKASFWHSADGDWETPKLDSEIIATNEAKVTYKVVTDEFSPFGVTIETKESTPYVPSSHSKQTGSTVILKDGEVVPTVTPTATPGVPTIAPSTKPTTQPTQKSPAPFVGLIAGLGAALVLTRLRK